MALPLNDPGLSKGREFPWFRLVPELRLEILRWCLRHKGVIRPHLPVTGAVCRGQGSAHFGKMRRARPFEAYFLVSKGFRREAVEVAFQCNIFCFGGLSDFNDFLTIIRPQRDSMDVWQHIRQIDFEINLINKDFYVCHESPVPYDTASDEARWMGSVRDVQYLLYPINCRKETVYDSSLFLNTPFSSVESLLAHNKVQRIGVYVEAFYGLHPDGARTFFHVHPDTHITTPSCVKKVPGGHLNYSDPRLEDLSYWDSDDAISFQFYLQRSSPEVTQFEEKRAYDQATADFIDWLWSDLVSETKPSARRVFELLKADK